MARVNAYIYFSEAVGNKIGRLNLVTNQVSEWNTPGLAPEGLDAAGTKVWCVEEASGKAAVLDTVKNTITEYPVSGAEAPVLLSHLKLFAGKAFFTDQELVLRNFCSCDFAFSVKALGKFKRLTPIARYSARRATRAQPRL